MNNLYEYKLALKLNKDINSILSIIENSMSALDKYNHFSSVKSCLNVMSDAKLMLELHNKVQIQIIENKGLIK